MPRGRSPEAGPLTPGVHGRHALLWVNADARLQHLDRRQALVRSIFSPAPLLPPEKAGWANDAAAGTAAPVWADVLRTYDAGQPNHLPWRTPIRDSGEGGVLFVPGLPRKHIAFWREVILVDHHLRDTLLPYLEDGVHLQDFLIDSHRGRPASQPYKPQAFRQAEIRNRIPSNFIGFVDAEVETLIARSCVRNGATIEGRPARTDPG